MTGLESRCNFLVHVCRDGLWCAKSGGLTIHVVPYSLCPVALCKFLDSCGYVGKSAIQWQLPQYLCRSCGRTLLVVGGKGCPCIILTMLRGHSSQVLYCDLVLPEGRRRHFVLTRWRSLSSGGSRENVRLWFSSRQVEQGVLSVSLRWVGSSWRHSPVMVLRRVSFSGGLVLQLQHQWGAF